MKCKCCGDVGHEEVRCPGQLCGVCVGKGHAADICADAVSVLACQAPADDKTLSDEEEAFICEISGNMFGALLPSGGGLKQKGRCALDWQVEDTSVICDTEASCHMSYSSIRMINYREAKTFMKTASGTKYSIEGYGDRPLTFGSGRGEVPLLLLDVVHVRCLSYHLFSLRVAADEGHTYTGRSDGVMVDFINGEKRFFPSVGRLSFLYAYRPNILVDETANATIAPGPMPNNRDTPTDMNDFHVAHTHGHEGALRKTAKQMGVTLVGKCTSARAVLWQRVHPRGVTEQLREFSVFLCILEARSS